MTLNFMLDRYNSWGHGGRVNSGTPGSESILIDVRTGKVTPVSRDDKEARPIPVEVTDSVIAIEMRRI